MDIVDDFYIWVATAFQNLMNYIGVIINTGVTSITGFVWSILADIVSIFDPVQTLIFNVITDTQNLLISAYNWLTDQAQGFTNFVTDTFNAVTNELTSIYNSITSWLNNLTGTMTDWIISMGNEVKGYFDMGYELLMSFFNDQWTQIENFMTLIKDSLISDFDDTLRWMVEKIQASFDIVTTTFSDLQNYVNNLWGSFTAAVANIVSSFEESITDLVQIVLDFFNDLWDRIEKYIASLGDYTQEQLESFIESAMTAQMNIMKKLALQV